MVEFDSATFFTVAAIAIMIGYVADIVFRKYKAPDILILMLFGWLIGPSALAIIGVDLIGTIDNVIPFVSSLALAFIMFNGGMELNLFDIGKVRRLATFISVMGFCLVSILLSLFFLFVLNFPSQMAILAGVVFGSTSAPTVIPLILNMGCSTRLKTVLTLESAVTDVLVVGIGSSIVIFLASDGSGPLDSVMTLLLSIVIALILGAVTGLLWLYTTPILKKFRYFYILTLAVILMLFALCEFIAPAGGGVIAVLVFGLVLGNVHHLPPLPRLHKDEVFLGDDFHVVNEEASFFIKVFFFTFLGLFVSSLEIGLDLIFYGGAVFLIIVIIRQIIVHLIKDDEHLTPSEVTAFRTMFPRGLCTVVTAILPFTYSVATIGRDSLLGIVALVVIGTTALTSVGAWIVERQLKEEGKNIESPWEVCETKVEF